MKVTYHGHSCVEVETGGKRLLIDPFITYNPNAKVSAKDLKADYILITHGHGDHVGDTVEIAKRNNATVIAVHELATYLSWQGVNAHGMGLGGSYQFDFGKVKLTQAFHSSSLEDEEAKTFTYAGMPSGILIISEGKTLYHAGDTGLFSDMKLIGEFYPPDIAFLPIGDNYTMGPDDALIAAEWVKAKMVVPIHYNTFPLIKQDGEDFVTRLQAKGIAGRALKSGESMEV